MDKHCTSPPNEIISSSNELLLEFHSDGGTSGQGYRAEVDIANGRLPMIIRIILLSGCLILFITIISHWYFVNCCFSVTCDGKIQDEESNQWTNVEEGGEQSGGKWANVCCMF